MASCKFYLALLIFCFSSINGLYAQSANILTKSEQQNGWHLLFDGKTFNKITTAGVRKYLNNTYYQYYLQETK